MPKARKTGKPADLGRAIQRRAMQDRRSKKSEGTGFHVADLERSNNPLQSITEASSLEEFMAAASMADRSFTAEKANIRFVSDEPALPPHGARRGGSFGPLSTAGNPSLRDVESGTVRNLRIPRRPRWDGATTAEQLHRLEKDSFLEWRRQLAQAEIEHGAGLASADSASPDGSVASAAKSGEVTPFEKNLEVWRQLWRVVERSDVLVQIVDARNPLMFRCPDLEEYVKEVNPGKRCLVVLNKADYLTPAQRLVWARYFTRQGLDFVFFSAKREQQRLEAQDRVQQQRTAALSGSRLPGLHGGYDSDAEEEEQEDGSSRGYGSEGSEEEEHEVSQAGSADAGGAAGGNGQDQAGGSVAGSKATGGPATSSSAAAGGHPRAHASASSSAPSAKHLSDLAAKHAARQQARADRGLAAAMVQALALDDSDSDSDSDSEGGEGKGGSRPARAPAPATAAVALPAEGHDEDEAEEQDEGEDESEEETTPGALRPDPVDAAVEELMTIKDDGNAGLDPSDPLFSKCTVLTRDALLEFFHSHYEDMPRGALGSGDEAARQRKAEYLAKKRAEAKAARKAELQRRRDQVQRMIEVGLGAHVRFGDAADARALDEEDEDEDGGLGDSDGEGGALGLDGEDGRPPLMVGMVGYPNVGKSSTINALLGATAGNHLAKRVAVASTPGKTKHFQTLPLDDDVTLCDCPGLVFPSFVVTREEMVVNGVLPIDNLRDHVSPVRLLCQRIPRAVLERYYGIKLPTPGAGQPANRQPTPAELLDAFCKARGFAAQGHGGLDHPRGSRLLLKDYCEGRLVYAHPPPGGWAPWMAAQQQEGGAVAGHASSSSAPRVPSRLGQASSSTSGGSNKVAFSDNVLLPRAQRRHDGSQAAATTEAVAAVVLAPAAAPVATAPAPAASAAATHAEAVDEEEEEDGEEEHSEGSGSEDGSEAGDDSDSDSDSLDEADLLAFAKVVVVKRVKRDAPGPAAATTDADGAAAAVGGGSNAAAGAGGGAAARNSGGSNAAAGASGPAGGAGATSGQGRRGAAAAQQQQEDEEDEEEAEEDAEYVATVYQGAAVRSAPTGVVGGGGAAGGSSAAGQHAGANGNGGKAGTGRAARERGLGRYGRRKKGERAADPYGTEAAADAASRRYYEAEIAAVLSGPAGVGEAGADGAGGADGGAAGALVEEDLAATLAAAASKGKGKTGGSGTSKTSKSLYDAGGAMVKDAVPVHLRGQNFVPVPVAVPRSLLRKKLQLGATA